ncbi:MAG: CoA transferase, partial [Alcaligenaceae bacterium]|nr:CoA transferase [Alcaligenaceae bacterium]
KTGDGKIVMLGIQNEREWALFCQRVLQQPDLATHPDYDSNIKRHGKRDALRALIEQAFATLTSEDVQKRLDDATIGNAQMNTMHDVWAHPQLKARDRWREVGSPAGPIPALLPPGINDQFDYRMDPIPALGEHTNAILHELGYDDDRIASLRNAGAL